MRNFYNRKVAEGGQLGKLLEETAKTGESTKRSTEEVLPRLKLGPRQRDADLLGDVRAELEEADVKGPPADRFHIHPQPAHEPQPFPSDTSLGHSPSAPIPTTSAYIRPRHPKVLCDQCNIKPEGFRGPHALRRHIENKHARYRTVWVCVDRSPDKKFLSECRACNEGKQYGAYYNAAAHLRRAHLDVQKKFTSQGKGWKIRRTLHTTPTEIIKLWIEQRTVSTDLQTRLSLDTEDSRYHSEIETIGSAAVAENKLKMEIHGRTGEQESRMRNTALNRPTNMPDHRDHRIFTHNAQVQASQPDAVTTGDMRNLNYPELAIGTRDESLFSETDESADSDGIGSDNARNASELLYSPVSDGTSGTSLRNYQYGPAGDTSLEAPHLETPKGKDPLFGQHAGMSIAESKLHLGPQEPVRTRRVRRKYAPAERQELQLKRKHGSCPDCRKAKRKVSVLPSSEFGTVTNTYSVYTWPARRLDES